ncbi:BTAD domain-containing putative transcriptional regulator [Nonomuraea sp. NPDC050783]|uniref:AfsR/SARP family transcriptional regulator n=1 Tax=Nonomuraea sp. NPDC050783 TaxID=3154634 RepID=UPI0034659AA3
MLQFRILGTLEVMNDEGDCTPTAPKLREVLSLLLVQPNRVVPTEILLEELWRGKLPRSAVATLQTYVYQLRKTLSGGHAADDCEILVTRPPGYMIRLDRDHLDAAQFERLVDEGQAALSRDDPQTASRKLHQALALWRERALADVEPGPRLAAHVAWLEESHLSALELRIEADMRLGKHRQLVGELRALAAAHPLHEWYHLQLMVSLHRSGRRADALDVYQRLRAVVRAEIGLEPSAELRHAQQVILEGSPFDVLIQT